MCGGHMRMHLSALQSAKPTVCTACIAVLLWSSAGAAGQLNGMLRTALFPLWRQVVFGIKFDL